MAGGVAARTTALGRIPSTVRIGPALQHTNAEKARSKRGARQIVVRPCCFCHTLATSKTKSLQFVNLGVFPAGGR
jgi:hypothetical protein